MTQPSIIPRSKSARDHERQRVKLQRIRGTDPLVPSPPTDDPKPVVTKRVLLALATHAVDISSGGIRRSGGLGRELLRGMTELVFRTALKEGSFQLPDGWGVLKVRRTKRVARLPTGQVIQMHPLQYCLKYEEGAAVRALLGRPQTTNYVRQYIRRTKLSKNALKVAKLTP